MTKGTELVKGAVERLCAAIAEGQSEQLQAYLGVMGRFRRYSPTNVLLIAMQQPTATHVAGFHAWRRVGRWVRKGECGIRILAPVVRRKGEEEGEQRSEDRLVGYGSRV